MVEVAHFYVTTSILFGSLLLYRTHQAPVINTHPADATKNIGETATFAVSAIAPDGGSLTYQWQRSLDSGGTWSDLDGAATSASYITPALTYADNGAQYRCVVTNSKNGTTATA